MNQSRYREIEAAGQPRELGRQIGEAAREEIQGFVSIGLERVKKCCPVSRDSALRVARESARYAEAYSPDMVTELHGTAEAAGVPFKDLMLLQVRNQLKPDGDCGCTSFSIGTSRSASGGHVLGQNWDNDPALDPFTVVVTRRAQDRPAFICVTQAGLISYIGCNEVGIGVCLNTLPAPSREVGVPHYFTVRGMYEARSLQEAVAAVERAKRCIPANIMMASPEGAGRPRGDSGLRACAPGRGPRLRHAHQPLPAPGVASHQ